MPDERDAAALYNFMSGLKSKLGFGECWFKLTGYGIMIEWQPTRDIRYREIVTTLQITSACGCHMDTRCATRMREAYRTHVDARANQEACRAELDEEA